MDVPISTIIRTKLIENIFLPYTYLKFKYYIIH